jgi:hypothetical protein
VCTPLPDTTACDDGTLCTTNNQCLAGVCVGNAAPLSGCKAPTAARKAALSLKNQIRNKKDQVQWKWGKGAATTTAEVGAPDVGTSYELCVYDAAPSLIFKASMPAGGTCAGKACWKVTAKKADYKDKAATPAGIRQLAVKPAPTNGKAKAQVKGQGVLLTMPTLPIAPSALPLTAQLRNSDGTCWTATFTTVKANTALQVKGQGQ